MKHTVSKELFEIIMNVNLSHRFNLDSSLESGKDRNIDVFFYWEDNANYFHQDSKSILINDLFFKCKDWALKYGYCITSNNFIAEIKPVEEGIHMSKLLYYVDVVDDIENWDLKAYSVAQNEQQAVFDACQWILENKGKL